MPPLMRVGTGRGLATAIPSRVQPLPSSLSPRPSVRSQACVPSSDKGSRRLAPMHAAAHLVIRTPAKVAVSLGTTDTVDIAGPKKLLSHVTADHQSKSLTLASRDCGQAIREHVVVTITLQTLHSLKHDAKGRVSVVTPAADLDVWVTGGGSLVASVENEIRARVFGNGAITLRGRVRKAILEVKGIGRLDAIAASLSTTIAKVGGAGVIELGSVPGLYATVTGRGGVRYTDVGFLRKQVSGGGVVRSR